jgi:L,D-transpeptidase YcbB
MSGYRGGLNGSTQQHRLSRLYVRLSRIEDCDETETSPVKQSRVRKGLAFMLPLLAMALFCGRDIGSARRARTQSEISPKSAAPPQQLSPEGQASLRTIIQAGNLSDLRWPDFSDYDKYVQKFYESYGYSLPWLRGTEPTAQAQQAIALLLNADQKGLSAEDYDGPRWRDRLTKIKPAAPQPSESDAVRFDVALTVCMMRYISDLHIGKVNPKHFDFGLDVEARKYDLPEFLKEHVVDASDVASVVAQVEPPYPGYMRTIQALHRYLQFATKDDGEQLPPVRKAIAPGDAYPGVPRLIRLLSLVGDLSADANVEPDGNVYQGALVDAVKNFQRRHGRDPNGRIDGQTLADLNVPLSRRVRQMQLTLERWRWLPLDYQKSPVVVNIPEFRLRAYDEKFKIGVTMNVVVGKAYGHDTPIFSDHIEYVIFRPYWSVPYSITKAEILPHIVRDPGYLAKKGLEVVNSREEVVTSGTATSDVLEQLRAGKLFVRQPPGPENALGLVKFIFPNDYNVYMHDTPAHELFSQSKRDFSHGCIRLEKPADLAAWVLRDNPGWDIDRVRAAMRGSTTQQVNLAHPIPVLIVYATVIVTEDGIVHFYDDLYGHDISLEEVLEKGYPFPD